MYNDNIELLKLLHLSQFDIDYNLLVCLPYTLNIANRHEGWADQEIILCTYPT